MKTKIYMFLLLFIFAISCSNPSTEPGNDDTINPPTEDKYVASGMPSSYDGTAWKFYSADGNTYDVTIKDGGISGLKYDNNSAAVSFDKSQIYKSVIYNDILLVYADSYKGYINIYDTSDAAYLYITDGTKVINGFIDNRTIPERGVSSQCEGTWEYVEEAESASTFRTHKLVIDKTLISYSLIYDQQGENVNSRLSIPTSWFKVNGTGATAIYTDPVVYSDGLVIDSDGNLTFNYTPIKSYNSPVVENGKVVGETFTSIILNTLNKYTYTKSIQ